MPEFRPLARAVALVATLAAGGAAVASPRVDLVDASPLGVRVRVAPVPDVPSRSATRASGFLVVLPPGNAPRLRLLEDRTRALDPVEAAAVAGQALPALPVRLAERARAGDFDLVRVEVAPITSDASGSVYHERLLVAVDFGTGERAPAAGSGAGARARQRDAAAVGPAPATRADVEDPLETALRGVVVNPRETAAFRARAPAAARPDTALLPGSCPGCVKVEVVQDAIYRVRFEDLNPLSPAFAGMDPRNLHVWFRGQEMPVEVDDKDGVFGPGDQIVFFGLRNRDRFSDTNVYWVLPDDGTPGLRLPARAALAAGDEKLPAAAVVKGTLHFEEQAVYDGKMPDAEGKDPWMSGKLVSDDASPANVTLPSTGPGTNLLDLAKPVPGRSYRLRARVVGWLAAAADDSQEMDFLVNGSAVAVATWSASTELEKRVDVPFDTTPLAVAGNTVRVYQPVAPHAGRLRWNYLDWVEMDYPRRLVARGGTVDFTDDPGAGALYYVGGFTRIDPRLYAFEGDRGTRLVGPRVLTLGPGSPPTLVFAWRPTAGASVRVVAAEAASLKAPARLLLDAPSGLRASAGAEYLVVSHPRFLAEAQRLADYRKSQGLSTLVADLTDVYDEFSDGIEDSVAVKNLVAHALATWPVKPKYVVLVGDASWDYRNYARFPPAGYTPPSLLHTKDVYLESIPDWRAASDSWFAAVVGSDFVPDVAIGRIPARAPGDLDAYRQKVEAYEAQPLGQPWMNKMQLFADDDVNGDGAECGIPGTIANDLDALVARYLPSPASTADVIRRYAGTYTMAGAPYVLQDDVLSDLLGGLGLEIYSGHGNITSMARHCDDGAYPIISGALLARVQNGTRLPLGIAMTCDAGAFDYAAVFGATLVTESIAESFLKAPDRGHVAWLATTAELVYANGADLTSALFSVLFAGDPVPPPANRVAGSIALGVALRHFADRGVAAHDGVLTSVVLGDPAVRLKFGDP